MGAIASQITSLTIVYSKVYSGADKKKTGLCAGNSPGTAENVSIWWRHHVNLISSVLDKSVPSNKHSLKNGVVANNIPPRLSAVVPIEIGTQLRLNKTAFSLRHWQQYTNVSNDFSNMDWFQSLGMDK